MTCRPFALLVALSLSVVSVAQSANQTLLDSLEWRQIGPFRGGRSNAVSGVYGNPDHYYMGTCGGGLWKTEDAGETWFCTSDGFFKTGSVGAVQVSQSNPDIVYVGMGETELRGNISHGDGVYKSTDAGKTWSHLGLAETEHIARVRIHPTNPDIAWVAALGAVYKPTQERGIYKTTDGGKTWKKTLFVNNRAGGADLCLDANNPNTLYATTWQVYRTPYSLESGGEGSKIFKSTDGGETWKEISRNSGLPQGTLGKLGIAVSPADSNRVYAMVEAEDGGLYRSDDAGSSWKMVNDDANIRQRPWYYTRVYADPKDKDKIWIMNVAYSRSSNGGDSLSRGVAGHSDHHDVWIDPENTDRVIVASDGGAVVSHDNGRSWTAQDYPTAQFYHCSTDNAFPYRVLGAQQDNSAVRIFSRTFSNGITNEDWESTAGGESGYIVAHPLNPDIVLGGNYSGALMYRDHAKRIGSRLDPWPDNPMGHGAEDLVQRFQWTYPIVFSPHDPNVVYTCSQFVLKSTDMGRSWQKISPDLTTNNIIMQKSSGGPLTQDNTGVEYYCTVFTLAESPLQKNLLWAGSDDGLVHISMNGGLSWQKVTPSEAPEYSLMSMVEASPHDPATAFLAVDNHENGDKAPYIFITHDYGKTWNKRIVGLPDDSFVRVVREDPSDEGVLYAGTETGVWVSYDMGRNWQNLNGSLPVVPIHDLVIKDDDLVVATHGRSFWILDDLSQVRAAQTIDPNNFRVIKPGPTHGIRFGGVGDDQAGDNPISGLYVRFWSPVEEGNATFEMIDSEGTVVSSRNVAINKKGYNVATFFNPSYPGYRRFPGMLFWGAGRGSISAPPGEYKIVMTVGERKYETVMDYIPDPRYGATKKDLMERAKLSFQIRDATTLANETLLKSRDIREKIGKAIEDDSSLKSAGDALSAKFLIIERKIYQDQAKAGQDLLNYPVRLNNKLAALLGFNESTDFGVSQQAKDVFAMLNAELQEIMTEMEALEKSDLAAFNRILTGKGKEAIKGVVPAENLARGPGRG